MTLAQDDTRDSTWQAVGLPPAATTITGEVTPRTGGAIPLTTAQITASLYGGNVFWGAGQFTYSIPGVGSTWPGYAANTEPNGPQFSTFSAAQAQRFRDAISVWDSLITPNFTEVADGASPGNIRVAFTAYSEIGTSWGYAQLPSTPGGTPQASDGDIWISAEFKAVSFAAGGYDWMALLHEMGHALGLKHPFETPPVPAPFETSRYTIMSYTHAANVTPVFTQAGGGVSVNFADVYATTPMVLDIAAIQARYGADPTTAAGDNVYRFTSDTPFLQSIYDAGGSDTIDISAVTRGSLVDLTPGAYSSIGYYSVAQQRADAIAKYGVFFTDLINQSIDAKAYTWADNLGIAFTTTIENVIGAAKDDTLIGNAAANQITGGGGSDLLDGGAGTDTAIYSGASASYTWTKAGDGSWTVQDTRAGSPDGADTLRNIEILRFSDRSVTLDGGTVPTASLATVFANVLRQTAPAGTFLALETDLETRIAAGTLTQAQALTQIVNTADATTSVATLAYQFFTGKIPSQGGIDYLVSPTGPNANNLNSAYYQSFNIENRYINFAVNLGKLGDGKDAFAAAYGGKTLLDTVKTAYATIFGSTPSDTKVHALIDSRIDYFAAYGLDGPNGIGTKAAAVGWLLAEAAKADIGMYSKANDAFLIDLADGATFAIDLVGVYGKPEYNFIST
ncbi:MAG: M10 family metallopeptidase C-terminal domain-containing protein [Caulobacteraceae bacterium]